MTEFSKNMAIEIPDSKLAVFDTWKWNETSPQPVCALDWHAPAIKESGQWAPFTLYRYYEDRPNWFESFTAEDIIR